MRAIVVGRRIDRMGIWDKVFGARTNVAPSFVAPTWPDARTPDEMPSACTVESFASDRGTGIITSGGERATFDASAWRGENGAPTPGCLVHVRWKRSRLGPHNIPAEIMLPAAARPEERFRVAKWLRAFSTATGVLQGLTAKQLMNAAEDGTPLVPWLEPKSDFPASQFMDLLESIALVGPALYPEWLEPRPWIHSCTWYDDGMEESLVELAKLVQLDEVPARQWSVNDFEPFLFDLDRTGAARGVRERLYVVDGTKSHLVVSFAPAVFERLLSEHLLLAHVPRR